MPARLFLLVVDRERKENRPKEKHAVEKQNAELVRKERQVY